MDEKFITSIKVNWHKVGEDSYVRKIPAILSINQLNISNNITFFVGGKWNWKIYTT